MRTKLNILFLLCCLLPLAVVAQQPDADVDSVWVEGFVVDVATKNPITLCEVQFMQDGEAKAIVFCDDRGFYSVGMMPVGLYSISVVAEGKSLHYAELQLAQSSLVNIALAMDSLKYKTLKPAVVNAERPNPKAVYKPIVSPDDPRLWNLNSVEALMLSGPASKDLSGGPTLSGLARHRPAWLDVPFDQLRTETTTDSVMETKNNTTFGRTGKHAKRGKKKPLKH